MNQCDHGKFKAGETHLKVHITQFAWNPSIYAHIFLGKAFIPLRNRQSKSRNAISLLRKI
jgi:hypothetical protein